VEQRWARGNLTQVPTLADELIRHNPAVVVTVGGTSIAKAVKATGTAIPIVFALGSDPVEDGLVASMNRPGGNVTGVTFLNNSLSVKRLELVRELVPGATFIAVLLNPKNARAVLDSKDIQAAADALGQKIQLLHAGTADELDASFSELASRKADALLVTSDAFFNSRREQFAVLAARNNIPAIYGQREFVAAGGLASYGSDVADGHRLAGTYTGRILKGAKPADLPVMQPTTFNFIINLRTAKALGLTVPPTLLARADEVIE
jgi:putative ABC transport system substrate-binding protein